MPIIGPAMPGWVIWYIQGLAKPVNQPGYHIGFIHGMVPWGAPVPGIAGKG
jgi:hypothetical protein